MKTLTPFLFCFFTICTHAQVWSLTAAYPGPERDDGVGFIIGNKAYCGTGLASWFAPLGDFYSYNLTTHTWAIEAPLPGSYERQYATGMASSLYGYLFGGINGNTYLNDLWRFEPGAGVWQQMASLPDSGRSGAAGFYLNNKLYIIGGKTSTTSATNQVWEYDIISNSWARKSDFPATVWRASACASDSLGYLAFGIDDTGNYSNSLWQYRPATDAWQPLASSSGAAISHSSLQYLDGYLLAFGGKDAANQYYNDLHRYTISTDSWRLLSTLPSASRKGGVAFAQGQDFYYTTGINSASQRLRETWKCQNVTISTPTYHLYQAKVYPNPATTLLKIELPPQLKNTEVSIQIVDATGRTHQSQALPQEGTIPVYKLAAGVYTLIIKTSEHRATSRFIKADLP